jgi:hypothetical protein
MRVSEAKSSGLFGNGARLPAMVSRFVIDVAIGVLWKCATGSHFEMADCSVLMSIVHLYVLVEVW